MLYYVEDLKRGFNADIGQKDFFEMASKFLVEKTHESFSVFLQIN